MAIRASAWERAVRTRGPSVAGRSTTTTRQAVRATSSTCCTTQGSGGGSGAPSAGPASGRTDRPAHGWASVSRRPAASRASAARASGWCATRSSRSGPAGDPPPRDRGGHGPCRSSGRGWTRWGRRPGRGGRRGLRPGPGAGPGWAPAGPGRRQVHGDGGGAGAALDAAGGDDQPEEATAGTRPVQGAEPGQLAWQVGDPVGPGEQAAGTRGERGPDVGRAAVVADGDQRGPAVAGQVGEGRAADQGDRRAAGQGGGQTGGAGVGHEDLPAGRALDRVPKGVGGAGVVVGDDDQWGRRRNGCEGHGHPPGASRVGSADREGTRPVRRREGWPGGAWSGRHLGQNVHNSRRPACGRASFATSRDE
jgi:hypothetical protein